MSEHLLLSFVVPVKDEEATIEELYTRIAEQVRSLGHDFDLIFIDDGSADSSWAKVQLLSASDGRVSGIRFRRNIGKANALMAGFEAARGEIVFTMDADLQDDPQEIPRFLEKLNEGFDVVSGWKKTRHDPWHKVLPSRVFNAMISKLIGVHLHDHNCGFKCYRAKVIKDVTLYGEMHRMVPSLASLLGYRSGEIPVQHHPRLHGKSKYGVKRFLRGFMDLLTVYFLKNYRERPLHLFGGMAVVSLLLGLALLSAAAGHLLHGGGNALGAAFVVGALPLAALGFFSELLISRRTGKDKELPISETVGASGPTNVRTFADPADEAIPHAPLILLVDDDARTRAIYRSHLTHHGYRTEEASNGVDAITKLTPETAVVILDMRMPGGGGLDALREIRRRAAGIKVIIISGEKELDGAVTAMKLGAYDYLTKPVTEEQLTGTVGRAVELLSISERHLVRA